MRRFFVLLGTMFFIRCLTMAMTCLPVQSVEHRCELEDINGALDYAREAWAIWSSGGLASNVSIAILKFDVLSTFLS